MQSTIDALTQKIYQEGIAKAEEDGQKIIEQATQKALDIVNKAEAKAAEIINGAERKAAEHKAKVEAELRLSSRQAVGLLKQRITDLIIWEVTHDPIERAFDDAIFVQRLIEKLVDFWLEHFGQEEHLRILLPEDDFADYQRFIQGRAEKLLKTGVTIEFKGKMEKGFQIEVADNRFKVSFTPKDFENYFRTFARPRTYRLLFGEDK